MSKNNMIINGIDVSECNIRFNHFEKNICELGNRKLGELHYLCSENPNCYFKQLKRLQEENEKLKKENKNYAKLMLEQQEISQKYWECIEKIKQAIEVLAETCNVYPLKTNLDKLVTTINEALKCQ